MSARDPQSLRDELDYWQALLGDLRTTHDLIGRAADELTATPLALRELALLAADPATHEPLERAMRGAGATMTTLFELQRSLAAVLNLIGGRGLQLNRQLGELRSEEQ